MSINNITKFTLILFSLAIFFGTVSAVHDAIITISPAIANCDTLGDTFTANVQNVLIPGNDAIFEVRIYEGTDGITDFKCGPAPQPGWTLSDFAGGDPNNPDYGYCEYKTTYNGPYVITPGNSVDFTFDAVMNSAACYSEFLVSTLDNKRPVGEHEYNWPTVKIDCTPPIIDKTVGEPKIPGSGFDWWVNQSTVINLAASDNTDDCDLGLDYCKWQVTIDGIPQGWTDVKNGPTLNWNLPPFTNSNHYIEVECYDVANNKATLTETDKVDSTPPTTIKTYGDPKYPIGMNEQTPYPHWITSATPITLTATDGGNICHIDVDKIYWRNTVVEDRYCNTEFSGCQNREGSGNWNEQTGNTVTIYKPEESCHLIEFYSVDKLGNKEITNKQCVFVDDTPPVATKTVGTPRIPIAEEFQTIGNGTAEWTDLEKYFGDYSAKLYVLDGGTDIAAIEYNVDIPLNEITALSFWQKIQNSYGVNVILGIDVDGDGIYEAQDKPWHFSHAASDLGDDSFVEMDGMANSSGNWENVNTLAISQWWTPDNAGTGFCTEFGWNYLSDIQSSAKCRIEPTDHVKVIRLLIGGSGTWMDKTAYVDDITLNGTIKVEPKNWWVRDHVTPITLTCTDQQPHPVDNEKVCFRVSFDNPQTPWLTEQYCSSPQNMNEGWCCEPKTKQIIFAEDSVHDLGYYCIDALGNQSATDLEYFKVDSVAPSITKTMIGTDHLGYRDDVLNENACPPKAGQNDKCYVKDSGGNGVHIAVSDPDPTGKGCNVGQTTCTYKLWWETAPENCMGRPYENGKCLVQSGQFGEDGQDVLFTEDSTHTLVVNCADALGNTVNDVETFLVDSTPPVTKKTYGDPHYPLEIVEGQYPHWITSDTDITLTATDAKVGVDTIQYRVSGTLGDNFCTQSGCDAWMRSLRPDMGDWGTYADPFTIGEESCHVIEYRSIDLLGNIEDIKWQCVFVDNTAPATEKTFDGPVVEKDGYKYITKDTKIKLTCNDQSPHPVDHSMILYRYRYAETCDQLDGATWTEWIDSEVSGDPTEKIVQFTEDSCHELEYYCEDILGNTEITHSEIDVVDTQPPVITKEISDPKYGQCPPETEGDICYIDGVTEIHVDATDPLPHPVNKVLCSWDYEVLDGDKLGTGQSELTPPFVINFPEESTHILKIVCKDKLGNETADVEKFIVDKTPPVTAKHFEGPQYPKNNDIGQYSPHWINLNTNVVLSAVDPQPHPSGVAVTQYRVSGALADKFCNSCENWMNSLRPDMGEWNTYSDPFNISEESCHVIEYRSIDNVDKTEDIKWQCVFVDNSPPTPLKTVGDPKDEWTPGENGDPLSYFYPEETANCGNGIDCWQVTTMTPITLECTDPLPHPVDNARVCFNVELDGVDKTQEYCSQEPIYGDYNADNGYCCLANTTNQFRFKEESEHNLKYYCVDALDNKGPVDEEKFKVEGKPFEILINKKWNLISVPFVLLNNDTQEVFKDIDQNIESVWAYDPTHVVCDQDWCTYWPKNEVVSNLKTIDPGYGYWVNSYNDKVILLIGGSLMSPQVVPPSRDLVKGWNLLGYYGTSWELYDNQDDYVSQCGGWQDGLNYVYGDKAYCALNSLVDTQQGYPKWSSLWTYINCNDEQWGSGKDAFVGINSCVINPLNQKLMRMYAGRGYWVELDAPDTYAPATTCIWNKDFQCVWTGGGITP